MDGAHSNTGGRSASRPRGVLYSPIHKEALVRAATARSLVRNMVAAVGLVSLVTPVAAQTAHDHTPAISGVPQGVPLFCADPTVTSAASGAWSDPATWSTKR